MPEILIFVLSLLGIIGLIFLTYYASRWLNRRVSQSGTRSIRILERSMFGQDKSLVIVKVGGKIMLLGVTAHYIEKISDLDEEDIAEALRTAEAPIAGPFLENLRKAAAQHPTIRPFLPKEKQGEHKDEP